MKSLTARELNRATASVLDAVARGETFELRRNGKAVGYITQTPPTPQRSPDWKAHFNSLRKTASKDDTEELAEFEQERRRHASREKALEISNEVCRRFSFLLWLYLHDSKCPFH